MKRLKLRTNDPDERLADRRSHYGVDPEDPFPEGYRLSDTWFR